jgi:hypothetical protein
MPEQIAAIKAWIDSLTPETISANQTLRSEINSTQRLLPGLWRNMLRLEQTLPEAAEQYRTARKKLFESRHEELTTAVSELEMSQAAYESLRIGPNDTDADLESKLPKNWNQGLLPLEQEKILAITHHNEGVDAGLRHTLSILTGEKRRLKQLELEIGALNNPDPAQQGQFDPVITQFHTARQALEPLKAIIDNLRQKVGGGPWRKGTDDRLFLSSLLTFAENRAIFDRFKATALLNWTQMPFALLTTRDAVIRPTQMLFDGFDKIAKSAGYQASPGERDMFRESMEEPVRPEPVPTVSLMVLTGEATIHVESLAGDIKKHLGNEHPLTLALATMLQKYGFISPVLVENAPAIDLPALKSRFKVTRDAYARNLGLLDEFSSLTSETEKALAGQNVPYHQSALTFIKKTLRFVNERMGSDMDVQRVVESEVPMVFASPPTLG